MPVSDPSTATTANLTRQILQNAAGQYNHLDPSRLNPIAVNAVKLMLATAQPTSIRFPNESPWEQIWINTLPNTASSQNYIVKVDQVLGSKDHISGSWIRSYNPSFSANTPQNVPWFNGSTFTEYHMNAGADWVHTFSSNLLIDVRFSYQRYWRTDGPIAANLNYDPAQLGFSSSLLSQLPLQNGFPEINFYMQQQATGTGNGYNTWLAMSRDFYYMPDDSYNFSPTVTWTKGKHSIRAGLDFRDSHLNQTIQNYNTMAIATSGQATSEYWNQLASNDQPTLPDGTPLSQNFSGNAVLDFLIGQPTGGNNAAGVTVQNQFLPYYTQHYYAPWIQDDWKITPNLTLNLGFRYDLNGPPTARHNWLNTGFDFNATNPLAVPGLPTLKGGITFPSTSGTNKPWAEDYTKWQPRIGFAWQARPGTVLRGGAGRSAMSPADDPQSAGFTNNPVYNDSPDGGRTYYPNNLGNPYPNGIPVIQGASLGLLTYLGQGVAFANPHYKIPSVINGSLGIQQVMPLNGKMEISYVMTRGYGMDTTYTGLDTPFGLYESCNATLGTATNPYPQGKCTNLTPNPFYGIANVSGALGTNTTTSLYQMARPYPQFAGITEVQNNWGRSWYNSLQSTYQQRLGWEQINATWTWSKTMQSGGYRDDVYLVPVRTIAGTDRQNRITVTSVLNFPVGRGLKYFSGMNRPLDAIVGGWELAANGFWETGMPVQIDSNNQTYNIVGNIRNRGPKHSTPDIIDEGVNQCVELWNNATPTTPGYYKIYTGNGQTAASCAGNVAWQQVATYGPKTSQEYTDQIRGPGATQIDVNLSKNFKFTERLTMQLRMEEFNVLNHPNWYSQVDMNPTDTNFGTVNKILTGGANQQSSARPTRCEGTLVAQDMGAPWLSRHGAPFYVWKRTGGSAKMKLRFLLVCLLVAPICIGFRLFAAEPAPPLVVPGFTAYAEPNPETLEISEATSIKRWSDADTVIAWYGLIRTAGRLNIAVRLQLPAGESARLGMKIDGHNRATKTIRGKDGAITVSFGSVDIKQTGGHRFALSGIKKSGTTFGDIDSLLLDGPAIKDALFNLTPQRGAPSVHLQYPLPEGTKTKWFYNEVTVKTDPIWSYYEACGFSRGYFGIQVNSPTERRIIFSVWDSGKESTDRGKVSEEDRVQLLAKGPGVVASDFGNEGTGGHSHLVYPWKTGETYRFLVTAQPDGESTIYSGYFYFPEKQSWGLIASFRAPKDGEYLNHLYSFNEDFEGANGQKQRLAEFGNQWIKTMDGKWIELTKARFTHTAVKQYKDRLDRGAGVVGNRFFLTNGGFKAENIEYNDEIGRPASGKAPDVTLPDISEHSER